MGTTCATIRCECRDAAGKLYHILSPQGRAGQGRQVTSKVSRKFRVKVQKSRGWADVVLNLRGISFPVKRAATYVVFTDPWGVVCRECVG